MLELKNPVTGWNWDTQLASIEAKELVRKAGLEPAWLAPPPPQDGVSASSTTSALFKILIYLKGVLSLVLRGV